MRSSINRSETEWAPVLHAEASSSQTTYRFGQVATEVDIDDPEVALWLAEFLCPWFSAEAPNGVAPNVRMTSSGERFSTLARLEAERHPQPLACFRLDRKVVSCPGWIEPEGTIFAADQDFGCYYHVQGNQVEVISRPQDRPARIGLMRVVRELAIQRALSRSETLDLHAAAFVFHGRAVLLEYTSGPGTARLARPFMRKLAAHIQLAAAARRSTHAEHLRDELREHHRLKEAAVLSVEQYEASKVRILAQHTVTRRKR